MSRIKKTVAMLGRLVGVDDFIGPRREFAPAYYAGQRFVPRDAPYNKNGSTPGIRDKFSRRRVRNFKMRGAIGSKLAMYRRGITSVTRLASNSHEKKRYLVLAKKEAADTARATTKF
mgnify:CR=1 FL=1